MIHGRVVLAVFPAADGPVNFARDDAMMARARATGETVIRVYAWDRAVVSFGRNERVVGRFSPERIRAIGLEAVRRPTGGRALLHRRELTYAVAGTARDGQPLRSVYTAIHRLLVVALRRLGVNAELADAATPPITDGAPCFAWPTRGELVVGARKLVASAQWRDSGAFLQHGSVLIDNDQPMLASAIESGSHFPDVPTPATLRDLLGRAPSPAELADVIAAAFADDGVTPRRLDMDEMLDPQIVDSRLLRYRDEAWTWRR